MSQTDTTQPGRYVTGGQEYTRDTNYIDDRITADAQGDHDADGRVLPDSERARDADGRLLWPVEAGRYRLVAARACPWANRTVISRRLLGLEDAISLGLPGPTHDARSWTFDLDPGGVDPVLGIDRLQQAFFARYPDYPRGITVPAIVDVPSGQVVTNNFPQITLDFMTEWTAFHRDGAPDLYPERLRDEIDEVNAVVFRDVNNGVYRAGFAGTQGAYDRAYDRLFARLDWLEERLATQRYLVGESISEADIRLFTTLARFDAVYNGHFKCNRNKLTEMPVLWAYARDLFQTPGFGDTIDFAQIKKHYYIVQSDINPTGIVPKGPDESGWLLPHHREELGGRPFGDGTPPAPPRPGEEVPWPGSAVGHTG
ncbi:glutathione S-transferase family protein [Cryobacterium tepidiphilum]|uniref:Glutathione S-transferase family protein n=1 Tax=Cryobacterium tepidiphilum TaxID=2486026 RepID=A0A3M8LNL9_9MICO|nr:glutathione S-transferase C-terminal domain-containing protein [Cryobacterium tepidiphilum]RNE66472.1 glutathione S-transferase family protein [Cryobacterium tepidiphilum]